LAGGNDRAAIFDLISLERDRQHEIWKHSHDWGRGDCSSPYVAVTTKAAVLAEECGEVARAVLEHDEAALRRELVQVAAVAVAWLETPGLR
jgi:NTP pyrophosphatase (non-canonical NTP hydrolase)